MHKFIIMEHFNFSQSGLMSFSFTSQIGASNKEKSKCPTFEDICLEMLYDEKPESCDNTPFYLVYTKDGYAYSAPNADKALSASLASTIHVPSTNKKTYLPNCNTGVFILQDGEYKLLYKAERFYKSKTPRFLSRSFLNKAFKPLFENIEITLGQLGYGDEKCIAWMLSTNKGVYYIPWHNGFIIPASESLTFEKRKFDDIRKTYKILRFHETTNSDFKVD